MLLTDMMKCRDAIASKKMTLLNASLVVSLYWPLAYWNYNYHNLIHLYLNLWQIFLNLINSPKLVTFLSRVIFFIRLVQARPLLIKGLCFCQSLWKSSEGNLTSPLRILTLCSGYRDGDSCWGPNVVFLDRPSANLATNKDHENCVRDDGDSWLQYCREQCGEWEAFG